MTQPVSRVGIVVIETGLWEFTGIGLKGKRWVTVGKFQVLQRRSHLEIDAGVVFLNKLHHFGG